VVRDADEVGASDDTGDETTNERSINDGDVIETSEAEPAARPVQSHDETAKEWKRRSLPPGPSGAMIGPDEQRDVFSSVDDAALGEYEVLGHVTTGDVLLPTVPLFSSLNPEAFVQLSHSMVFLKAPPDSVIFEEGQPGDSCIVISRGRARVTKKADDGATIELMHLGEGDVAGIFALMSAQTRQATLTATTELEYFEIDRSAIDDLVQTQIGVRQALEKFFRERLLLNLLAGLPFFSNLSAQERQSLARRFTDRDYEPGDELFFEGAEHDGIWVVLNGKVALGREKDGAFVGEKELVPGDFVGSLARLDTAETDMGAQAMSTTKCALLTHKAFSELLSAHPDLAAARERFTGAGVMVGQHVFAGNGTLHGHVFRANG
jgi:CRP-like cAMP-binding protein